MAMAPKHELGSGNIFADIDLPDAEWLQHGGNCARRGQGCLYFRTGRPGQHRSLVAPAVKAGRSRGLSAQ